MQSALPTHPWAIHLNPRRKPGTNEKLKACDLDPAPFYFDDSSLIRSPDESQVHTVREFITLDDVVAFREETTKLIRVNPEDSLSLQQISLNDNHRRVIYRLTDIVKDDSWAVLEAIHFEIFMPDRKDLRFITVPIDELPEDSIEGDYFEIYRVQFSPSIMHIGFEYHLDWRVTQFKRIERRGEPVVDYVYTTEKDEKSEDVKAVCNWANHFISLKHSRFQQTDTDKAFRITFPTMEVDDMYNATLVDTSAAWIYPVEPPKNIEEYVKLVREIKSTSQHPGTIAQEITVLSETEVRLIDDRLEEFKELMKNEKMAEQHMIRLFQLGERFRQLTTPPVKVIINFTDHPIVQVNSDVPDADAAILHFEKYDVKLIMERIEKENDEKKTIVHCLCSSDLRRIMESKSNDIEVNASFRRNDLSSTVQVLERIDHELSILHETGEAEELFLISGRYSMLLGNVYDRKDKRQTYPTGGTVEKALCRRNGQEMRLTTQQKRALGIYRLMKYSILCVQGPSQSGKTTLAAVLATKLMSVYTVKRNHIVKQKTADRQGFVQMLLAVKNSGVDKLAVALKEFDDGKQKAYRLQSNSRIHTSTPYGILDHFSEYKMWMEDADENDLLVVERYFEVEEKWKASNTSNSLNEEEKEELNHVYRQSLLAAKDVLEEYLEPETILSTVDLALEYLLHLSENGVRGQFWHVDRIIIDDASLLTESSLYCLIRCFPNASFALIGDDKKYPFMYDEDVLGHELAGRSALEVAMYYKNFPIVKLKNADMKSSKKEKNTKKIPTMPPGPRSIEILPPVYIAHDGVNYQPNLVPHPPRYMSYATQFAPFPHPHPDNFQSYNSHTGPPFNEQWRNW